MKHKIYSYFQRAKPKVVWEFFIAQYNTIKSKVITAEKTQKREKQTRYLSQAIQLEEAVNPYIIRSTMIMVSTAVFVFLTWAGFTDVNEVARTSGDIVPRGHTRTLQHLEGGIVHHIDVEEGQIVNPGDPLITLSDTVIKDDLDRLQAKHLSLEMQTERLKAYLEDRDVNFGRWSQVSQDQISEQLTVFEGMKHARMKEHDLLKEQMLEKQQGIKTLQSNLETLRKNLEITQNMHSRIEQLHKKGFASDMKILRIRMEMNSLEGEIKALENNIIVAEHEVKNYEERLLSLSAHHRDEALEKLSAVSSEISQNKELIEKVEERISRLVMRSPARGLVKGLILNTQGSIIAPGQVVLEIVPLDEALEVSVKISPQDVGHIHVGQAVQVKFSSFDFSRYGTVKGTLDKISATTFSAEDGSRYYQGRVLLEKKYVGNNPKNTIIPGMTVMADIITGKKTILEYLLKPIHVSLKTAFSER